MDWEGTGPRTQIPMGAAGTLQTGSASGARLVSPPEIRPQCPRWGFLGLRCCDLGQSPPEPSVRSQRGW